ncbi:hypothetical protein MLD38_006969 [Melastoma candidum]|uniref:Uncharacterized protein n=1 Tax=Melastoma candidum TaxID=119954 RepID=A0ACB9RTT4_9MYRT|nr:hypothetical protein MLD38_006969 [Melastoma candidum]
MASYNSLVVSLSFLILVPVCSPSSPQPTQFDTLSSYHQGDNNLVRASCVHTLYPAVCLHTLSAYRGPTSTPYDVARAALKVSLTRARSLTVLLSSKSHSHRPTSKKERAALRDCTEMISSTVDELSGALNELKQLGNIGVGREAFGWAMSNAETWVSAALTDEDTCLEGFNEGGVARGDVIRKKIRNVAKVTSNALYMINKLDKSKNKVRV